jgi:hypothetical protein
MSVTVPVATVAQPQTVMPVQVPAKKTQPKAKSAREPTAKAGAADLAVFFRKLSSQPDLLERFSSSPAGREEILARYDLPEAHKALLVKGRVRDIISRLEGAQIAPAYQTVIIGVSCADDDRLNCGHDECKAFMVAVKSA